MSNFFKKKKVEAEVMEPGWLQKLKKGLPGEFEKLGVTDIEKLAQTLLTGYMGEAPGLGMGARLGGVGEEALIRTITGGFDPYTSPEYGALRRGIEKEGEVARGGIQRRARKTGMGFATPSLMKEARLEDLMLGAKGDVLAQLMSQERGRQAAAIPQALAQALGLAQFGEAQKTGRIGAGFGYGGLERDVLSQTLAGKMGVAGMQTPYGLKTMYGPSPFQETAGMVTDLIAAIQGGSPSGKTTQKVSGEMFGGGGGSPTSMKDTASVDQLRLFLTQ